MKFSPLDMCRFVHHAKSCGFVAVMVLPLTVHEVAAAEVLDYHCPAKDWSGGALPIGNGRMGAMLFGGVASERIQFNEQSLWSGDNNWDGDYQCGDHGFGAYRNFGDVTIHWQTDPQIGNNGPPPPAEPGDYHRRLDLNSGIHRTSFSLRGVEFSREAFASHPDQVLAFEYRASRPGSLSGRIALQSAQGAATVAASDSLMFAGEMPNKLKHACRLRIIPVGGKLRVEGNQIVFSGCDRLRFLLNARTNYQADYRAGWRGVDPLPRLDAELAAAAAKSHAQLRKAHVADLSSLLGRVRLDVGVTAPALLALPTDARLKRYAEMAVSGPDDPDLEETMFQYGRYLLASCSRPGGLPANLQGLWNDSNQPAWASDYHNNINVQMNYWGAESTNLSECHRPLIDFIVAQAEPCRVATRKAFGAKTRGWTARTSQNIFGGNGWDWNIPASAWYAMHAYERFAFSRDKAYLKSVAYPMLKEICELWEDRLKEGPNGLLMVPNGWSPEHGPREDGVMHDQQLIWELFADYLEAAAVLGVDPDYQKKVAAMQARLAPNRIGRWGQLQEWQADRDDPNDTHRHTSHLFAVYPGRQISRTGTPDLANAAIVSLKARSHDREAIEAKPFNVNTTIGDSRREWAWAWRCGLWARLGEGERAGVMLRGLLAYNTQPNLLCIHPPIQLDGNFGISGTIAEMLLQSHAGEICLLPAIPKGWAKQGQFTGLRARGDYTVDCAWRDGRVTHWRIHAGSNSPSRKVKLRVNGQLQQARCVM